MKLLSHTLRKILSHQYARELEAGEMMRKQEGLESLFKAWCGVALNGGMTGEGGIVHGAAKRSQIQFEHMEINGCTSMKNR